MDSDESDQSNEEWSIVYDFIVSRRPRLVRQRPILLNFYNDLEFRNRFRMSKESVWMILQLLKDKIKHKTSLNNALSPEEMLLLTLRYYATGAIQGVGDVSNSTASRLIARVSHHIALLRDKFLTFPTSRQEVHQLQRQFYMTAKFPRAIAALGCTHVKITSPGGDDAKNFHNSKGFYSLNVQMFCDNNLNILDIVARWPGSTDETTILQNSRIHHRLEEKEFGNAIALADNTYQSNAWLMTPVENASTPAEVRYNAAQKSTQNCIVRCFESWKRRFPVLSLGIRMNLMRAQSIIVATAILHNICNTKYEATAPEVSDELTTAINTTLDVPKVPSRKCGDQNIFRREFINYFDNAE